MEQGQPGELRCGPQTTATYRTGVVSIAGRRFTVTQFGTSCRYSLSPTNNNVNGFGAATGAVSVTTTAGCRWSVGTSNDWVTITPQPMLSGSGASSFRGRQPEFPGADRSFDHCDQLFPISQAGAPCTYALTPANRAHGFGPDSGSLTSLLPSMQLGVAND